MKIAISSESTIDLPKELLAKYDISIVPYTVLLGERSAIDGEITPDDIFEYVDETHELPKTSAINEYQYLEHFKKLKEKYDTIIHITLSGKITCAVENAKMAAKEMENVHIVDSFSLSTGIALLAIYACELRDEGLEVEEIVKRLNKRKKFIQASFVVNTLNYLHKGGRCSGVARISAAVLRIKPQILLKNGAMVPGKKYFGKNSKVVESYCKDVLDQFDNADKSIVFVTHSHASQDMIDIAKACLIEKGFTNIVETVAGATITSHCGPKTLGILYMNDGGVNK